MPTNGNSVNGQKGSVWNLVGWRAYFPALWLYGCKNRDWVTESFIQRISSFLVNGTQRKSNDDVWGPVAQGSVTKRGECDCSSLQTDSNCSHLQSQHKEGSSQTHCSGSQRLIQAFTIKPGGPQDTRQNDVLIWWTHWQRQPWVSVGGGGEFSLLSCKVVSSIPTPDTMLNWVNHDMLN